MPDPEDDEVVSKKVVYEHSASSGSSRSVGPTIIVIAIVVIAIVAWVMTQIHR
ncbi:MAG: hypothetical protein QOI24_2439 [Acidobacteriota bacterium]|jgi:hypothetical protein|nr:hypothetical protein [Acidobacteriota bacterium]